MTSIEWTEKTWNPIAGCTVKSDGCQNCYALNMANRLQAMGLDKYQGLVRRSGKKSVWTGKVNFDEKALLEPLKRKKPTRYFVNSMSDLFHENVPNEWIDHIFAVMALCPQHTFQVLTKRPERMLAYVSGRIPLNYVSRWDSLRAYSHASRDYFIEDVARYLRRRMLMESWSGDVQLPLSNVWLGVSIEDQKTADERIPLLLETPAAIRWVSAEPLLGPVRLIHEDLIDIDWMVVGGESGPGARPMHKDWAHRIKHDCKVGKTAFLFKQWGSYSPNWKPSVETTLVCECGWTGHTNQDFSEHDRFGCAERKSPSMHVPVMRMYRVGKKEAGRELDGKTYDEYPEGAI